MSTVIAACQIAPQIGRLADNIELSRHTIDEALARGAQVVVLPELVTSGYVFASAAEAASVAVTPAHPLFAAWADQARAASAVVVAGFAEAGDDGRTYNSAAIVDGSGVRAVYRKLHLWDAEKLWFAPGDALPPVVATAHGRIAAIVCYDLEFCELTRAVGLAGAELLAVPTNWPYAERPAGTEPPEVVMGQAAARANRMVVACADRTGVERGVAWTEGTSIIDELGWVVARPDAAGVAVGTVDLARTRHKGMGERNDLFADRRPELYGVVAEG